ncbi:Coa6p TDEL_0B01030 [Torulaspora delbrueckii]|uniref:Cytochrome c oxidase assembly factor 6 n=1 Tax=Torulaspora delbrueckii TaxID=4950 RepID=G8ZNN8_TORDE|nr:hypothetical protein TDEL_0B01030 [Torulaspora delbrueckii]CCE90232.1 hypothetical protein TDEL_0B01030 [Torulaspora delbrueckii]
MGWFSKKEYSPADRSSRQQCWEARDGFFHCLDGLGVVNALDPKQQKSIGDQCGNEEHKFRGSCAESWVKYFKEKRVVDYKKEQFVKEMEKQNATPIELTPEQMHNQRKK